MKQTLSCFLLPVILLLTLSFNALGVQYKATVLQAPGWTQLPHNQNRLFDDVYGVSDANSNNTIWFCGEDNLLMKKEGVVWYDYSHGQYGTCSDPLYDIAVNLEDPDVVCAVGYDMCARTWDGGQTWTRTCWIEYHTGTSVTWDHHEENFVYCLDNGAILFGVDDIPWEGITNPYNWPLNGIDTFLNWNTTEVDIAAVGDGGRIFYVDNYLDWGAQVEEATLSPVTSGKFNEVAFSDDGDHGVAVGNYGMIYYSTNYGRNWTGATTVCTSANLNDVRFDGSRVLAVGDNGTIIYAWTSNLNLWLNESTSTTKDLYTISEWYDLTLLACGEKMPTQAPLGLINSEDQQEERIIVSYDRSANQNTLSYRPHESGEVNLSVYDVHGRMVSESNYFVEQGIELTIDFETTPSLSQLPNGVYGIVIAQGEFTGTQKCVITN